MPVELRATLPDGTPIIQLGMRPRFRFREGEEHMHKCPSCHTDRPCRMDCEYEPDLSDEDAGGPMRGTHVVCIHCKQDPSCLRALSTPDLLELASDLLGPGAHPALAATMREHATNLRWR